MSPCRTLNLICWFHHILQGHHVDMAEEHGALLLAVEHRFYGDSINPDGLKTENLADLSSQQALVLSQCVCFCVCLCTPVVINVCFLLVFCSCPPPRCICLLLCLLLMSWCLQCPVNWHCFVCHTTVYSAPPPFILMCVLPPPSLCVCVVICVSLCVCFFCPDLLTWLYSTSTSAKASTWATATPGSALEAHTQELCPPGSEERWQLRNSPKEMINDKWSFSMRKCFIQARHHHYGGVWKDFI